MKNPREGLPEHLFEYLSSLTPLINVDLIVFNQHHGILLSWREDKYYGPGWHVPGGIIRFKENFIDRLDYVAKNEININQKLEYKMISINQIMNPHRDVRGHFISLLFASKVNIYDDKAKVDLNNLNNGDLMWHYKIPENIIPQHKRYKKYMQNIFSINMPNNIDIGNILNQYNEKYEKEC